MIRELRSIIFFLGTASLAFAANPDRHPNLVRQLSRERFCGAALRDIAAAELRAHAPETARLVAADRGTGQMPALPGGILGVDGNTALSQLFWTQYSGARLKKWEVSKEDEWKTLDFPISTGLGMYTGPNGNIQTSVSVADRSKIGVGPGMRIDLAFNSTKPRLSIRTVRNWLNNILKPVGFKENYTFDLHQLERAGAGDFVVMVQSKTDPKTKAETIYVQIRNLEGKDPRSMELWNKISGSLHAGMATQTGGGVAGGSPVAEPAVVAAAPAVVPAPVAHLVPAQKPARITTVDSFWTQLDLPEEPPIFELPEEPSRGRRNREAPRGQRRSGGRPRVDDTGDD